MSKVVIKDKTILNKYIDILKTSIEGAEKELEDFEKDPSQFYTESMKAVIERCSNMTVESFEKELNEYGLKKGYLVKCKKGSLFCPKERLEWRSDMSRGAAVIDVMYDLSDGYISDYSPREDTRYLVKALNRVEDEINSIIFNGLDSIKRLHKNSIKELETLIHSSVDSVIMDEVEYAHILKTVGEEV